MRNTGYTKVSKIRCPWRIAPCHGSGHWAKKKEPRRPITIRYF